MLAGESRNWHTVAEEQMIFFGDRAYKFLALYIKYYTNTNFVVRWFWFERIERDVTNNLSDETMAPPVGARERYGARERQRDGQTDRRRRRWRRGYRGRRVGRRTRPRQTASATASRGLCRRLRTSSTGSSGSRSCYYFWSSTSSRLHVLAATEHTAACVLSAISLAAAAAGGR